MIDADVAAMTTWDVEQLRTAVAVLDAVLDRLPATRHRFDEVTRTVWSGAVWSGPAGLAAAGSLSRLSAVAHSAGGDLEDSIGWLRHAVSEAAEAQEVAHLAAEVGDLLRHGRAAVAVQVVGTAGPDLAALELQLQVLQDRARQHATGASAAATRAADTVPRLDGVVDLPATSWCGWTSGTPGRQLGQPPRMPTGETPEDTAAWWSVMSPAQQLAAIARDPVTVGALAGVPAWARDRANRVLLARAMAVGSGTDADTATAIAQEISDRETAGERVQLLELDVDEGLAAVALGDLDAAEAVGVLVPGKDTDVPGDLDAVTDDAAAVADAARAAAPGVAVATVAWLGYRAPSSWPEAAGGARARSGGQALDRTLDGLAAARGAQPARVTILAHSYGTVVTDRAVDAPGDLAADAVVLQGSPGMSKDAHELEVDEVYEASSPTDVVAQLQYFGNATWDEDFGAERLPTDWDTGHSEYYDSDRPTLTALGEVVAGVREPA